MMHSDSEFTFLELCSLLQEIEDQRYRGDKITLLSAALALPLSDNELLLMVQFTGEGAFPDISGKRISAGARTIGLAAADFCKIDYDIVYKPSKAATGSHSETIERLMENVPEARSRREPAGLSLSEVQQIYEELWSARNRKKKTGILHAAWETMTPLEIKFFLQIMKARSPLAGLQVQDIEAAIAGAFKADLARTRHARMKTNSLGETALLARKHDLEGAEFRLFQPVPVMHTSPATLPAALERGKQVAEDKLDGLRAQLHIAGTDVQIFDKNLNNISHYFPDVVEYFQSRDLPPVVLDGVLILFKKDRTLPLPLLQARMKLKNLSEEELAAQPALFIAFDLLFHDNTTLVSAPFTDRRNALENLSETFEIPVTRQFAANSEEDLLSRLNHSFSLGNDGLILKQLGSAYEYGERNDSWLHLKKQEPTLSTMVMYAHAESDMRKGPYSRFTLGVSVDKDPRYEESFIPIGKIDGGFAGDQLKLVNDRVQDLVVERYGPTIGLKPGLALQVTYRRIRINNRTKAGFDLQTVRPGQILTDANPEVVHTLTDVEKRFYQRLEEKRTPQLQDPSFIRYGA